MSKVTLLLHKSVWMKLYDQIFLFHFYLSYDTITFLFVIARPKNKNQKVLKFQINRVCTLFSYFVIPGHYFLDMAKQNRNSQ